MAALRQRMIEDMRVRNFSPYAQEMCLDRAAKFAKHLGKSPEVLEPEEIRTWQVYLINNKNACESARALRFLHRITLEKERIPSSPSKGA